MEPLKDEIKMLPCKECGEEKPVNVVYLPYITEYICFNCSWKKKKT